MKKILLFEGAGCVPRGDLENCRIRTAFTNDEGKQIYLELIGTETTSWADHCFYINDSNHHGPALPVERIVSFKYSKTNILRFVNANLHCSFDDIAISDGKAPGAYRVFGNQNSKYNFMEDYQRNS